MWVNAGILLKRMHADWRVDRRQMIFSECVIILRIRKHTESKGASTYVNEWNIFFNKFFINL